MIFEEGQNDPVASGTGEHSERAANPVAVSVQVSASAGWPPGAAIPEDLRVPWDWIDLAIFALIAVVGVILVNVLVVLCFAALGVNLSALRASPAQLGLLAVVSQTILFLALLGYLAVQMRVSFHMPFWRTIGWRPLDTGRVPAIFKYLGFIGSGLLLSFLVQLVSSVYPPKGKLPIEALFEDRRTAALIMLMSVLLAPVVEETIFRGYIYPVIARTFGMVTSVFATGVLFGLLHSFQLWGGWIQIASLVGVGIIFTYARASSRSVLASYLLHVSYNSFILIAFLISSHGLRVMGGD